MRGLRFVFLFSLTQSPLRFCLHRGLPALLSASLLGCGGGEVHMTNLKEDRSLRPPEKTIEYLSAADPSQLEERTQKLHGALGDNLDWPKFWRLLAQSEVRKRLVPEHQATLLSVQYRSCDSAAFDAYVQFIAAMGTGFEYVLGEKRSCATPLPSATTVALVRAYQKEVAQVDDTVATQTLVALNRQLQQDPNSLWGELLASGDLPWLRRTLEKNLNSPDPSLATVFAQSYLRATGELVCSDLFSRFILKDNATVLALLQSRGAAETGLFLADLASQNGNSAWTISEEEWSRLETVLLHGGLAAAKSLEESWTLYLQIRRLFSRLLQDKGVQLRLRAHERHQLAYEKYLQARDDGSLGSFLESHLRATASRRAVVELTWFAFRRFELSSPLMQTARHRLQLVSQSTLADACDQVLWKRLQVHLAESEHAKRVAGQEFCQQLEAIEVLPQSLSSDAWKGRLEEDVEPGCFTVETPGDLRVTSDKPLRASINSLVRVATQKLALEAPSVELGLVDLSNDHEHDAMEPLPVDPKLDAVALPLVLGISMPKTGQYLARGTHFFVLHFPAKRAMKGPTDTRQALKGYAGGSLEVVSENQPLKSTLIAEGGPGQKAAPAPKGGRGDSSTAVATTLTDFVADYEANGQDLSLETPYVFHSQLSAAMSQELIESGKRNNQNELEVFLHPDFSSVLPEKEQIRFQGYCSTRVSPITSNLLTPMQISECAQKRLVRPAIRFLSEELERLRASPTFRLSDFVAAASIATAYELSPGPDGKAAKDGAVGDSGEFHWRKSHD